MIYIGIDVSKDSLDVSTPKASFKCNNNKNGFDYLLKKIKFFEDEVFCVCEATGGYELKMALFLDSKSIDIAVVTASKIKNFIKSYGEKSKTDKADANYIRTYGELMKPEKWTRPSDKELLLKELLHRREEYTKTLSQEKNRLSIEHNKKITSDIKKHIKFLEKSIGCLEKEISKIIDSNTQLSQRKQIIEDIKGFGKISAMSLITYLPELGTLSRSSIAALVGVAPYNRDSGSKNGKRYIRGGRKNLRDKLFMPTLQAMRFNPVIKDFYGRLMQRGKPFKVCLIACMRKLLIHLNAKVKYFLESQNQLTN